MTLEELRDAYRRFREDQDGLPEMDLARVLITPTPVPADPFDPQPGSKHLAEEIAHFAPDAGWLCYQSKVVEVKDGNLAGNQDGLGLILSGELTNAAGESLHIRQDGRGGWLVSRFTPDQGDCYLADIQRLIVHAPHQDQPRRARYLRYRRYWKQDEHHGVRQHAACFIGFSEDD